MKNKKIILYICCLLTISVLATGCKKEAKLKVDEETLVQLDNIKITATQYYETLKEKNVAILVDMIDKDLLEKDYPSTKEEDKNVESQIKQIKENYPDEKTYTSILNQYFSVNNEEELKEVLRLEYKRNQAVKNYISSNLSDKEIEKYYEDKIYGEVKASHILIIPTISEDADEEEKATAEKEAEKTAKKVIDKLNKGEDFKKLAKKYSQEQATATNGGDLGYFELDEMVEEFSNAVKELKVNEYTKKPVKTKYGYHVILKTDEKEKAKLKDIKEDIKEKITLQKLDSDVTLYYQTLIDIRKDKNIKWNDSTIEKEYDKLMKKILDNAKESIQQQ